MGKCTNREGGGGFESMSFVLRGSLYGITTEAEEEAKRRPEKTHRVIRLNKQREAKFGKHGKNGKRERRIYAFHAMGV